MGEEWRGGDVARFAGGGHKINMLVRDLAPYKDDKELVIMFTDRLLISHIVLIVKL
jgi:hypothetical protein